MEILPLSLTQVELKLNNTHSRTSTDKRIERRKPNWTECENVFLLDQFSIHREILTCKATDASTNLRKQEVWRIICQNLNKQNVQVRRTPAEVRRKWKNLVTAAKKEVWEIRHQAHVTGTSRKLSELSQRVLQLHSTTASAVALFMSGSRESISSLALTNGNNEDSISVPSRCHSSPAPDFDGKAPVNGGYFAGSHFIPIVQFSESVSSPNGSCGSSGESRNEFDSGIYEDQVHDLRVNKSMMAERKTSDTTTEEIHSSSSHHKSNDNEDLLRVKLELQIEVLRLRKRKLEIEVRKLRRMPAMFWRKNYNNNKLFK